MSENKTVKKLYAEEERQVRSGRTLHKKKSGLERFKEEHPVAYNILDWVKLIAIAVAIALVLNLVIIINSIVPSSSMEPTIMKGNRMIGSRLAYIAKSPERGDVIIFKYPDDTKKTFVKRVIGLPGETVEIIGGVTYIDGKKLNEPYLAETPAERDFGPFEVPEDSYFCMGDNRNNSNDARFWVNKYVSKDAILGKAKYVYWPFGETGQIE